MRKPFVQTDEPLKLYRDTEPIEYPVDQTTLTERYTEEAVKFIEAAEEKPFFLYLAHSMPHLPVSTSEKFVGTSDGGLYGDVIETIDWSVGRIRETLAAKGIAENTLLVFTSDNGPWLDLPDRMLNENVERWHGGSPGPLRGAKGTTYEGGMRVPMIACWPGHIPAGTRNAHVASTMDLLPTIAAATGASFPKNARWTAATFCHCFATRRNRLTNISITSGGWNCRPFVRVYGNFAKRAPGLRRNYFIWKMIPANSIMSPKRILTLWNNSWSA
jgi:arylsulfatase A